MISGLNNEYNVMANLFLNNKFKEIARLYGEYKLVYIEMTYIPKIKQGTLPPTLYILPVMNEELEVSWGSIPDVQGVIIHPGTTTRSYKFYRTGRNDDFDRWYNVNLDSTPKQGIKIYQRASSTFVQDGSYYEVRIRMRLLFRGKGSYITVGKGVPEDVVQNNLQEESQLPSTWYDVKETREVEESTGLVPISSP